MTPVGITCYEKPSRDKNIDDCQQIGVKFERIVYCTAALTSLSDKLSYIAFLFPEWCIEGVI